ncbi:MAG: hypothetical protein HYX33_01545 [Actinobacteria bacterium]|nr:hypothetical protein [Actinomycetota bacterium]
MTNGRRATQWRGWVGPLGRRAVRLEVAIVLVAYFLLAAAITWPVLAHPNSLIPAGSAGGDPLGYLWDIWSRNRDGLDISGIQTQTGVAEPFGRPIAAGANATLLVTVGPAWVLAKFLSPVLTYNVILLLGLTLTGGSAYLMIRWLGLGRAPAAWAGIAYMLFPYELTRVASHLPLAQLWCFPLLVIAGVRWIERPGLRRAAWLAAAFALAWLTDPYYGVMATLMVFVVAIVGIARALFRAGPRSALRQCGALAAPIVALVVVPLAILLATSKSGVDASFSRSRIELELYGARLSDYVLPISDDPFVRGFLTDRSWLTPPGERANFLGFAVLILLAVGLAFVAIGWRSLSTRLRIAALVSVPIGLLSVWVSLASPYRTGGLAIPMPSSAIFDVLPYIRVYARFVVPVMTVALVIACVGLAQLMAKRTVGTNVSIMSAVVILTGMGFLLGGPVASGVAGSVDGVPAARVPVWNWLAKDRSGAVVIETPAIANEANDRYYMWGQTVHGKRIANGSLQENNLSYSFLNSVADIQRPGVATRLATVGVGLATIEPWAWARIGAPAPDPRRPPPGFSIAAVFGDGSAVWRVTAKPLGALAFYRTPTFWVAETIDGETRRWMRDVGQFALFVRRPGRYRVRLYVKGFRGDATYRFRVETPGGGRARFLIRGERRVAFTFDAAAGTFEGLVRSFGPPPRQISAQDLRVVTLQLGEWQIERLGAPTGDPVESLP